MEAHQRQPRRTRWRRPARRAGSAVMLALSQRFVGAASSGASAPIGASNAGPAEPPRIPARRMHVQPKFPGSSEFIETPNITWTLPLDETVMVVQEESGAGFQECPPLECQQLEVDAGVTYTKVQLQVVQHRFGGWDPAGIDVPVGNAKFRIVSGAINRLLAQNGACQTAAMDNRVVLEPFASPEAAETTSLCDPPAGNDQHMCTLPGGFAEGGILNSDNVLKFRMGGSFKLCYTPSGTFDPGEADVWRRPIKVNGVFDNSPMCNGPDDSRRNCLSHHRYECYLRKEGYNTADGRYGLETSCQVNFAYGGAGFVGNTGAGTWTSEFRSPGYNILNGRLVGPIEEQQCGTEPARFICQTGGACDSGAWPPAIATEVVTTTGSSSASSPSVPENFDGTEYAGQFNSGKGTIAIPTTSHLLGKDGYADFVPRTVAACYCPARGGCDEISEFTQQIGLLHFYISKVCSSIDPTCGVDYTGVTGQYPFRIRVECPTDACAPDMDSRVKLIARKPSNDLPSWNSETGCRDGVHGEMRGYARSVFLKQPYIPMDASAPGYLNEDVTTMSGGTRQDYKEFGGRFGFQFFLGDTRHERRSFDSSHMVDVCFCHRNCEQGGEGWFKVGGFRLSPTRLVSAATWKSSLPAQWSIEYVNQPGTLGLHREYADAGSLGLSENSLLKIVKDVDRLVDDRGCSLSGYNSQLTEGLSTANAASMNYLGKTQRQTPPDLKKVVFNSDAFANMITVKEAGSIAVCYCAITVDGVCTNPESWKLITHMTIKGPDINQKWLFSTNVVFRFEYPGWGLTGAGPDGITGGDRLRIISSDGSCTDNNYNPNTAAYLYTGLMVGCPGSTCTPVGTTSSEVPGDLITGTLTSNTYDCDRFLTNCRVNDIDEVEVLDGSWTRLHFQHPHGFKDGEEITLGANIHCDNTTAYNPSCTVETEAALRGVYHFGDHDMNNGQAPDSWMDGHRIRTTDDPRTIHINVGWPDPKPIFKVFFAGAQPGYYIGRGGQWKHRSRASTREEIKGMVEKANLRVCWMFGGPSGKYVREVGRLSIRNPAPLTGATISMTSTLSDNMAPMILTFKTAPGVIGARYDAAEDSLRLKITLTQINKLDINYSHPIDGGFVPYDVPLEDDFFEAKQSICGKLFLEMWSDDMARGFPLPKGCFYKSFPQSNSREIIIVFEGKSGLRKDTTYMLVFNGMAHGLDLLPNEDVAELATLDDITSRPYEAIEWGRVQLQTAHKPDAPEIRGGEEFGGETADPRFREPGGIKIVGGFNDLLELSSGDTITFELMGGYPAPFYGNGPIQAGQIIRIFLWPLTQWQTTSSCTADCLTGGAVSFSCSRVDHCKGLSTVPGQALNILQIRLPDYFGGTEALKGNSKVQMRVGGITLPSGGFFAGRLGAQVSKEDDSRPHYVITSGDYIWKQPNRGQTVSKLVATVGGSNTRPFRGDTSNVIYARILLSSTIFARDRTGTDASFTITLPQGYKCLQTNPLNSEAGDILNGWAPPDDLPVFREIPQGRGLPTDGTPTHGWTVNGNTCTFTPAHPYGAIYAGSSMMIQVTVDNPTAALPRADPTNFWTIRMANRGLHHSLESEKMQGLVPDKQVTQEFQFLASGDAYYQSNAAVMGIITQASCQPTTFRVSWPRPVEQELRFFFRSELEAEAGGSVIVHAPEGFYWNSPCYASDLQDAYYATAANPGDATLRLPSILACQAQGVGARQAKISLQNILLGGRMFAFKISVQNPSGFDLGQVSGWRIFTADSQGYLVDGTPGTVPFRAGDDDSWGVYSGEFKVAIQVVDRRPYEMRREAGEFSTRSQVRVMLSDLPEGNSGHIRLNAPPGYEWDMSAPFEFVTEGNGSTAPFPIPIFPVSGTSSLVWNPTVFSTEAKYYFVAMIRVPSISPTTESDMFFFELGYNASYTGNSTGRSGAVAIPAPPVRSLKNAMIDFSTNIQGKENQVEFIVEVVTAIPQYGGMEIIAPADYLVAADCATVRVRDPDLQEVMPEFDCYSFRDILGRNVIRLIRNRQPALSPGLYAFGILMENPKNLIKNYMTRRLDAETVVDVPEKDDAVARRLQQDKVFPACGTFICWSFATYKLLQPNGGNLCPCSAACSVGSECGEELDYRTTAQGFSINRKMLEARIPLLTEEQRRGTQRDDRPLSANNVIFAIKLQADVRDPGPMQIRAPYGFEFPEECMPGIEVSEARVFGLGNRFPPSYTSWPEGVRITHCRGKGIHATIELDFDGVSKLATGELYLIRVGITQNPIATPVPNYWYITINDQTSEPIEGMTLWAFTDMKITPTSTARDRTLMGEVRTQNPLKIQMRPFNTIPFGGEIKAEAELGFQFVSTPNRVCDVELVELPYVDLGIQYNYPDGYAWAQQDLVCLVDAEDSRKLAIRIRGDRRVTAGLLYRLVIVVYNPGTALFSGTSPPTKWKISSFSPDGTSLDESRIEAFRVNTVMDLFYYSNPDARRPGEEMRNGGERLPEFVLRLRFPSTLEAGDKIVIQAPTGPDKFGLEDYGTGRCRGLRWVPEDPELEFQQIPGVGTVAFNPLPNSNVLCNDTVMTIDINEAINVPRYTMLQIGLQLTNPLRTPLLEHNFWRCTLYNPGSLIKSSKAFQSWTIIPQLEEVEVSLIGTNQAAEAVSSIRVAFTAVTFAEDVAIEATSPIGFDFAATRLQDDVGQSIILTDGALIRIRMAEQIFPGKRYVIDMHGVRLGKDGGQTEFQLTTWLGGMMQGGEWKPGDKKDERLSFTSGFRLPGLTLVRLERIKNTYMQDPLNYPVQSEWRPLMGRPAFVEFHFHVTRPALVDHYLVMYAVPYEPTMREFVLEESELFGAGGTAEQRKVDAMVESVTGGKMYILLAQPLVPFRVYKVRVSVIAPHAIAVRDLGMPVRWTIETRDGGLLPTNTNDGTTREFPIVEEYGFVVEASRAPPTATVELRLTVDPGISVPTELRVVAPLGFNFTYNCLVEGMGVVLACNPGNVHSSGRATAVLQIVEEGIRGKISGVRITTLSPQKTPVAKEWFVEGMDVWSETQMGWGEHQGFELQQMADTTGVYPGIPTVRAYMVWRLRSQVLITAGGYFEVHLPVGLSPECGPNALLTIAMPASGGCDVSDPTKIRIFINNTIVPGEYAFAFYVTPPVATPLRNTMSLILKDRFHTVRDAAVAMPAPEIMSKLKLQSLPLMWSTSRPGRPAIITIGFRALEGLPDLIVAGDQQVSELLITLPVGFSHNLVSVNDFTVLNEDMPLRASPWLDFMRKDKLRITMDLNKTGSWTTLKKGDYAFRFSVNVPSPLPIFNVWHLSLCKPSFPGGCLRLDDPGVMINFAIPGFRYGETSPIIQSSSISVDMGGATVATGAAAPSSTPAAALRLLLLLPLFLLFRGLSPAGLPLADR
eukprot:TRINITY_DN21478_c0_g1_i1.p1 TRINITY_DN21478_c0_g1~~TRINITY_DN21478_c0_g1_i1.p1  ORF type:complete len:3380 (+),score=785.72 TRINITY_DN21478_c0_g1_i1:132-10271(+)